MSEATSSTAIVLTGQPVWLDSLREMGFTNEQVDRAGAGCTSLDDALALIASDGFPIDSSPAPKEATLPATSSAQPAPHESRQVSSSQAAVYSNRKRKARSPAAASYDILDASTLGGAAGAAAASGAGGSSSTSQPHSGESEQGRESDMSATKRRLTCSGAVHSIPSSASAPAPHLVVSLQDMTGASAEEAAAALQATGCVDVLAALEYLNTPAWLRADAGADQQQPPSSAPGSTSGGPSAQAATELTTFTPKQQAQHRATSSRTNAYRDPTPAESVEALPSIHEADSDDEHDTRAGGLDGTAEELGMDAATYALVCSMVSEGGAAACAAAAPSATPPPLTSSRPPPPHAFSALSRPDAAAGTKTHPGGFNGVSAQQRERLRQISAGKTPCGAVPPHAPTVSKQAAARVLAAKGAVGPASDAARGGAARFSPIRVRRSSGPALAAYNANARGALTRGGVSRRGRRPPPGGPAARPAGGFGGTRLHGSGDSLTSACPPRSSAASLHSGGRAASGAAMPLRTASASTASASAAPGDRLEGAPPGTEVAHSTTGIGAAKAMMMPDGGMLEFKPGWRGDAGQGDEPPISGNK